MTAAANKIALESGGTVAPRSSGPSYAGNGKKRPSSTGAVSRGVIVERNGHLRLVLDYDFPILGISSTESIRLAFDAVVERLRETHADIKVNQKVLAGTPHIDGTRLSVAHILADLHHLGTIDAVGAKYRDLIDCRQIKSAIAYAHDFLETACDLSEGDD